MHFGFGGVGLTLVVGVGLVGVVVGQSAQDPRTAAVEWLQREARALPALRPQKNSDELQVLKQMVGSARLVSFGEAMHGSHEFFTLRNRIFAYLVDQMGFSAIALETGFADSIAADEYVRGGGSVTREMIEGLFSYASPKAAEENLELVEWIRDRNLRSSTTRRISIYGIDMVGTYRRPEARRKARKSLDMALAYVESVNPATAEVFRARIEPLLVKVANVPYESMAITDRDALTLAIADLAAMFERRRVEWVTDTSSLAYVRGYRNVINARHLDADMRTSGYFLAESGDINQRDASLADNVQWALEREGPSGRLFLFAFNGHVRKGPNTHGNPPFTSMGQHLHEIFGKDMVAIGSVFGSASGFAHRAPPSTDDDEGLPRLLGQVGLPAFVVDLRRLPTGSQARKWWNQPRAFGMVGATNMLNPLDCFDALIFIQRIVPAQALR